ncbi:Hypothetical Protein FCC1311_034622 [Hondaea fermentalgiana]|uniref:Uncharacterized protein n=1 Tax=Hondaea fermentalgiana TaxID=2315210 RepID=A0A2R5G8B9_9STRA|nr:Hypothetical Protein FCC1311_034622 [Hondaea fermentalgiana]|eukprot:GBG27240.1 Hypothetical Protein FCC1311_034622 [Hondaea fermentalgiana]
MAPLARATPTGAATSGGHKLQWRSPQLLLPLLVLALALELLPAWTAGSAANVAEAFGEERLNVRSTEVLTAAQVALQELRSASDSGVYETLELAAVRGATAHQERFHRVLKLTVDLTSQHFEASKHFETELTVFKDPGENGPIRSVAVTKLPEFAPDVMERFRRSKVRDAMARRERLFQEIEQDYLRAQRLSAEVETESSSMDFASEDHNNKVLAALATKTLIDMKALPDTSAQTADIIDEIIQKRLDRLLALEAGTFSTSSSL